MKTTFKVGALQIEGLGVVRDLEITQEYSAGEAIHMMVHGKKFVQGLLKELPEMMLDVEKAHNTYMEIDERAVKSAIEKHQCKCEGHCAPEPEQQEEPKKESIIDKLKAMGIAVVGQDAEEIEDLPEEVQYILNQIIGGMRG